mgnify:CR=1 FL=1
MSYALRFLPEVEEDVIGGYAWYEAKLPGFGEEFLLIFYAGVGEISHSPLLYPEVHEEFRRCLLRRFPYAIYFTIKGNEVIVFGLFHCARDPRTVRTHLRNRDEPKKP